MVKKAENVLWTIPANVSVSSFLVLEKVSLSLNVVILFAPKESMNDHAIHNFL